MTDAKGAAMKLALTSVGTAIIAIGASSPALADPPFHVVDAAVTTESNLQAGKLRPVQQFGNQDMVHVYLDVAWSDAIKMGSLHRLGTKVYRNDRAIATPPPVMARLTENPWHAEVTYAGPELGDGSYTVDILLDGQVLSTQSFQISDPTTSIQTACDVPDDPASDKTRLSPISRTAPDYPAEAMQSRIEGCALVRYDLDDKGVPQQVDLITEYPRGWGFGDSAVRWMQATRYKFGYAGHRRYRVIHFAMTGGK